MDLALIIIGWIGWLFCVYLAASFAWGCRSNAKHGMSFHWATAIQTFFWWLIAIVFLLMPVNKLHILWLLPLAFYGARYLVLAGPPLLSRPVMFLTRLFMRLLLAGTGHTEGIRP